MAAKRVADLRRTETTLKLHGREQAVHYRSKVLLARFLDGLPVRVVWCEYRDGSPWRQDHPVTGGQIRKGLLQIFRQVPVLRWWNRTCRKFEPPNWRGSEHGEAEAAISLQ